MSNKEYDNFIDKWISRPLYTSVNDVNGELSGMIIRYRDNDYKLKHIQKFRVVADVFSLPRTDAFKNEKQRKDFIKEAKMVGINRNKSTQNEYYYIINLI